MDFSLTDEQRALADLAGQILTDACTLERLKAVEHSDDALRPRRCGRSWPRPGCSARRCRRSVGGSGGGFFELCLLLEQQGTARGHAAAAADARLGGAAAGALRLDASSSSASCPASLRGKTLLTAALTELGADSARRRPRRPPDGARLAARPA